MLKNERISNLKDRSRENIQREAYRGKKGGKETEERVREEMEFYHTWDEVPSGKIKEREWCRHSI